MTSPRRTYRFGPLERRGLLGPVRAGQAATLAAGALAAVLLLDTTPSLSGVVAAMTALASAAGLATAPLAGRTPEEWAPVVGAYLMRGLRRRHSFRQTAPSAGVRLGAGGGTAAPARPHPPAGLRDVELVPLRDGRLELGAVSEQAGRRLTSVLACRIGAFGLLDAAEQERRLAQWGLVLASIAGTPVRRLQWIERTSPAQGDELARWLVAARDPAVPLRGTPIIESYLELIAGSTRVSNEHEILLAVQIDVNRIRDRGGLTPAAALAEQVRRVARGLEAADIEVLGALTPRQLARAIRIGFDPFARTELAAPDAVAPAPDGSTAPEIRLPHAGEDPWPLASEESWDGLRCDGACHATFWISGWPRTEAPAAFMDALLGPSAAVRSVAVIFEPISPERSTREVEAAITRDRADRELRRRFGQSETARQQQAQEAAMRREAELAAGHSEVRVAGFVTVSGRDPQELRAALNEMIEHAARARLELRRLYGQQAEAFTFTLPLARGLR